MAAPTMSPDLTEAIDTSFHSLTLDKLIYAAIALAICILLQQLIMRILNRALNASRIEKSLHTFLKSLIRIALYAVTILIVADSLDFPVTTLVAMVSVAGLAVTLAVQDSLSNLAGGILVLTAKPFVVGDVIQVLGTGGTVIDITLFYTKIAQADDKIAFFPNRMLSSAQMVNYTAAGRRRLEVSVKLAAALDESAVREALLHWTENQQGVLAEPEASVRVIGRAAGVTEYALCAWVQPDAYWSVYYGWVERASAELSARFGETVINTLTMSAIESPAIGEKVA